VTLPRKSRQIQIVHISTFLRQGQNRNLFISMYNSMIQKIREAIGLFTTNLSLFSLIVLTVWLPGSILSVYLRLYVFPEIAGGDEFRIAFEEFRVESAIEVVFGPLYVGAILYTAFQLTYIPQVRSEEIIKAEDTEDGKEWHQNSRLRI
jgi:hypothetical protein